MKLLLDSCTTVLLLGESESGLPSRLPTDIVELILNAEEVYISVATLQECATKISTGKPFGRFTSFKSFKAALKEVSWVSVLSLDPKDIDPLEKLPKYHKDPFDRTLISIAMSRGLFLVTCDTIIPKYASSLPLKVVSFRQLDK